MSRALPTIDGRDAREFLHRSIRFHERKCNKLNWTSATLKEIHGNKAGVQPPNHKGLVYVNISDIKPWKSRNSDLIQTTAPMRKQSKAVTHAKAIIHEEATNLDDALREHGSTPSQNPCGEEEKGTVEIHPIIIPMDRVSSWPSNPGTGHLVIPLDAPPEWLAVYTEYCNHLRDERDAQQLMAECTEVLKTSRIAAASALETLERMGVAIQPGGVVLSSPPVKPTSESPMSLTRKYLANLEEIIRGWNFYQDGPSVTIPHTELCERVGCPVVSSKVTALRIDKVLAEIHRQRKGVTGTIKYTMVRKGKGGALSLVFRSI